MEELKLIIDAMQTLGAEGKQVFFAWLIVSKVVQPAVTFSGIVIVIWSLRYAFRWVKDNPPQ